MPPRLASSAPALRLIFAFVVALAVACGGSSAPTTPSAPSGSSSTSVSALSGRVYNVILGATVPVAGARVEVMTGANAGKASTSDAAGLYRLDGLVRGDLSLRLTAGKFETSTRTLTLSNDQTLDVGLTPTELAVPGRVVDIESQAGIGSVSVSGGNASTTTDAGGNFMLGVALSVPSPFEVVLSGPSIVERRTSVRAPGSDAVVSVIASAFNLAAFDEMARTPRVERWTTAPPLVIETRSAQYVDIGEANVTTIEDQMSDAQYSSLVADLTRALGAMTGNTFTSFASVTRRTTAPGVSIPLYSSGVITVVRLRSAATKGGVIGYAAPGLFLNGRIGGALLALDRDFDGSQHRGVYSLRAHELGHALGYSHVTSRTSVMNGDGGLPEPNPLDLQIARMTHKRPPGNRSPDVDPAGVSTNGAGGLIWARPVR